MADARDRAEWNRTAWISCDLRNAFRGEDSPIATPEDCNPYTHLDRVRNEGLKTPQKKSTSIPYNPSILEAAQRKYDEQQKEIAHGK